MPQNPEGENHRCGSSPSWCSGIPGWPKRTEGVRTPHLLHSSHPEAPKCQHHCQAALRRFLTILLAIGCEYGRNFDGAHLQGVTRDSLRSFKVSPTLQGGETCALRAYFERARSRTRQYVSYIYSLYNICYCL
jgi:hypothetical protein